jgi:calcium-dependent protein kinase
MSMKDVLDIIKNLDLDNDGNVDFTEFVSATINRRNLLSSEKLETVFKLFDKVDYIRA